VDMPAGIQTLPALMHCLLASLSKVQMYIAALAARETHPHCPE